MCSKKINFSGFLCTAVFSFKINTGKATFVSRRSICTLKTHIIKASRGCWKFSFSSTSFASHLNQKEYQGKSIPRYSGHKETQLSLRDWQALKASIWFHLGKVIQLRSLYFRKTLRINNKLWYGHTYTCKHTQKLKTELNILEEKFPKENHPYGKK